jgi:hypothetical protein
LSKAARTITRNRGANPNGEAIVAKARGRFGEREHAYNLNRQYQFAA